jgi:hypothetical protein
VGRRPLHEVLIGAVSMKARPWARWWALGGGLLLLALGWCLFHRESLEEGTPSTTLPAQPPATRPARPGPNPVAAFALDRGEAQFQTLLVPDGSVGAIANSVRVGLAQVSAEEAASYRAWLDSGAEGAGPSDPTELATVERWIPVPAQRRADGTVEVGPFQLPAAHRYDLLALGEDDLHVYAASFTCVTIPATVGPTLAAGLRIHQAPPTSGTAQVLLRRTTEQPDAAMWQAVMGHEAPALLAAFGDEPLALSAATQTLAPLPPGTLEVQLLMAGIEAERHTVVLKPGVVTEVRFDPVAQAVAHGVSVDLRLRFVVRDTGAPIRDLRVTRQGGGEDAQRVSDKSGYVSFRQLDRQQLQRFELRFPAPEDALPTWPEAMPLEVSLEPQDGAAPEGRLVERTIELTPLQWLRVRTGSIPNESARQVGNPYPIFVLQRQAEDGGWLDASSDYFLPVPEGLAVSIAAPGRFRVMAAVAPWTVHLSTTADALSPSQDGTYRVDLNPESGHSVDLVIQRDGIPLTSAPVLFQGPARGMPPRALTTDGRGRLRLDGVTRDDVVVEIPGSEEVRVDVRGTGGLVEFRAEEDAR